MILTGVHIVLVCVCLTLFFLWVFYKIEQERIKNSILAEEISDKWVKIFFRLATVTRYLIDKKGGPLLIRKTAGSLEIMKDVGNPRYDFLLEEHFILFFILRRSCLSSKTRIIFIKIKELRSLLIEFPEKLEDVFSWVEDFENRMIELEEEISGLEELVLPDSTPESSDTEET